MKKIFWPSLIINVVLLLSLILLFIYYPRRLQNQQKAQLEQYTARRVSVFRNLPMEKGAIVFLGASLIEGANWAELFQNPRVKNRGIGGNRTQDILNRVDTLLLAKPAKLFIQCGYNDLANGIPASEVLKNYATLLTKIRKATPQTLVYIIGLFPVLYELNGMKVKNEDLLILNGQLKDLCQKNGVAFLDFFNPLQGNDLTHELNPSYTNDGLHLNADGYTRLKALLERYVNETAPEMPPANP
ncbi:MAG: SGNH/GDSL hydrolase family protein [Microscillaceae bacterium]